jgi:hypothetical protein
VQTIAVEQPPNAVRRIALQAHPVGLSRPDLAALELGGRVAEHRSMETGPKEIVAVVVARVAAKLDTITVGKGLTRK